MGRPRLVLLDEPDLGRQPVMVEAMSATSAGCTRRA